MKTEKCPICGGKKKKDKTIYSVDTGIGVVVVRSVPCFSCVQCGEEWIDNKVARELEVIVSEAKAKNLQTEIVAFPKLALV